MIERLERTHGWVATDEAAGIMNPSKTGTMTGIAAGEACAELMS